MRIILVHSIADLYGASRSLLRLSSRLVQDNHDVLVILKEEGPLIKELESNNVSVKVMSNLACVDRQMFKSIKSFYLFIKEYMKSGKEFKTLLKEYQPDIVHTNTALILTSGFISKKCNVPHIWHIRESFKEFGVLWLFYRKLMLKNSDLILSVSTPIAEQFDLKKSSEKVSVLYNGFPMEEFEGISKDRVDNFKQRWGINNTINIGVVGRLKLYRKGQEVLIKAASVLNEYDNLKFLLIGDPFPGNENHLNVLKELVKENDIEDKVVFTGGVEDIKAAYLALDVSVLTSCLPEPFGGVVIESMALERPVIGTSIGGTIEQIDEGVTGLKVPPNDHEKLAEALKKLIDSEDLRVEMGKSGRRRFVEKFEFEAFYEKLLEFYNDLLG